MIRSLSKIFHLNQINIVGVIRNENTDHFNLLSIKKQGSKIEIKNSASFDSLEKLCEKTDYAIPVILVIDGKGVLNKKIDFKTESDLNWYKNIDLSTIYHTSIKSDSSNFMSFCRKNQADEIISKFSIHKFQIIDIYIGAFPATLLNTSLNKKSLQANDLILQFENNKIVDFYKINDPSKTENYTLGKNNIDSRILPLYGALIHFYTNPAVVEKSEYQKESIDEFTYKKAFNTLGVSMLVFFLFSLLTSYLLIQHYNSKNAELNLQNVYSNQTYQQIVDLEKQKESKMKLLNDSGLLSSKFISFYAYEIIHNIPKGVDLNELNILPPAEEIRAGKKVNLQYNTIQVKGGSFNEGEINKWLGSLNHLKWMKKFEIISLKKDKKNKTLFEVKITLNNV